MRHAKRAMRHAIRKPCNMIFKRFAAQLTEINIFLTLFPGSDATNNMPPEELNAILIHTLPNGWAKQANLQGWDFKMNMFRETCAIFK